MFNEDKIAEQLAAARAELNAVAATQVGPPEPVTVENEKGRIRVTVGSDGRLTELMVSARAIRDGSDDLGPQLMQLVNEALDKHREHTNTPEAVPDLNAINEKFAEMQDRSLRNFAAMSQQITETMAKLQNRSA
ncbi:hypothetical protein [Glycomyces sp. NPDC048151]|uniref:hypothetical protein n=1 Tax=Glycomyces sp. NPDC048151 TaxID=3364002 RepID=UPI00372293DB